jgi:hypothetical protein
LVLAHLDKLIA